MTEPSRFTFDLDLGSHRDRARLVRESAFESEIAKARQAGYAEGFAEGERGAATRAAEALARAAQRIGDQSAAMNAAFDDALARLTADAAELALVTARKLASGLIARQPLAEIEALLADCLATLRDAPHLVVRCHPDLADAVSATATAQAKLAGYDGRLVVMGEPEIVLGDCRIEWADGGLVRDLDAVAASIAAKIDNYLAAPLAPANEEPNP